MLSTIRTDLDRVLEHDISLWEGLRGKRIFATGCTGFIGAWLIHSFSHLNSKLNLGASLTILTRNRGKCSEKFGGHDIRVVEGDILDFRFPEGNFDLVIHGATEVACYQSGLNPEVMLDVAYLGTKRLIEFAKSAGAERVLFLSSGAVYGKTPQSLDKIAETYAGAPDVTELHSFYGEGKRLGEMLLFSEGKRGSFAAVSARIFASCGPFLPMESDFAFANFLKAALLKQDIEIKGNGKPTRSYLYGSDLILWLWTMLLRGKNGEAYNVGSEEEISIGVLAEKINAVTGAGVNVKVLGTGSEGARYIPSTAKARVELKLPPIIPLDEAIRKSFNFHKEHHEV